MRKIIMLVTSLISFSAVADCWIVKELSGYSISKRNNYIPDDDKFSGKFMLSINGDLASVSYSGVNTGGMIYKSLAPNTIVGLSSGDSGKLVIENWSVQNDGAVLMTKIVSGYGDFNSVKAFKGSVSEKC